ncbi:MAG: ECF transporter S component [Candidatus Atribacteria bacterium]|nr:ECF transporter S component [Candidatus Atribacteria bacterium]
MLSSERVQSGAVVLTRIGVLLAVGMVLPVIFHGLGIPGNMFLPMHFPALLAGFILLNPGSAFVVGFLLPLLNFLISGMPPFPVFLPMMVELGSYGALAAFFAHRLRFSTVVALIMSLILGRVVFLLAQFGILGLLFGRKVSVLMTLQSLFVTALPGIVIQLVLIPIIVGRVLPKEETR